MAAFASSSVKNTKHRNEMWELLWSMSTGRSEVSMRILNALFRLTCLCAQQDSHPYMVQSWQGHNSVAWGIRHLLGLFLLLLHTVK